MPCAFVLFGNAPEQSLELDLRHYMERRGFVDVSPTVPSLNVHFLFSGMGAQETASLVCHLSVWLSSQVAGSTADLPHFFILVAPFDPASINSVLDTHISEGTYTVRLGPAEYSSLTRTQPAFASHFRFSPETSYYEWQWSSDIVLRTTWNIETWLVESMMLGLPLKQRSIVGPAKSFDDALRLASYVYQLLSRLFTRRLGGLGVLVCLSAARRSRAAGSEVALGGICELYDLSELSISVTEDPESAALLTLRDLVEIVSISYTAIGPRHFRFVMTLRPLVTLATRLVIERGTVFEWHHEGTTGSLEIFAATNSVEQRIQLGQPCTAMIDVAPVGRIPCGSCEPAIRLTALRYTPLRRLGPRQPMKAEFLKDVEVSIDDYVGQSTESFQSQNDSKTRDLLVVKYLPAPRLRNFLEAGKRLYASAVPGYTWGDAVYVTPLNRLLASMMYGRVGIVGRIRPRRVFDASGRRGIELYQTWITYQWQWYRLLTTTVHADQANRYLRNRFRTRFGIDCVTFTPDQFAPRYVNPNRDVWFAITHWQSGQVASGISDEIVACEWCAVGSEEFSIDKNNTVFLPLLGAYRPFQSTRTICPTDPSVIATIEKAYDELANGRTPPMLILSF